MVFYREPHHVCLLGPVAGKYPVAKDQPFWDIPGNVYWTLPMSAHAPVDSVPYVDYPAPSPVPVLTGVGPVTDASPVAYRLGEDLCLKTEAFQRLLSPCGGQEVATL